MPDELLRAMARHGARRCFLWSEPASGLRAVAVVDSVRAGRSAGGIRTRRYDDADAALADAAALARSMSHKCALADLAIGGCKIVVLDHEGLDREAAFAALGSRIEELGGLIRTAGDLGTTDRDLGIVAEHTRYVHTDEPVLSTSVARGLLACVRACVAHRGSDAGDLSGLRVGVQGCGSIGRAVIDALLGAGASIVAADLDPTRTEALSAERPEVAIVDPATILRADVDVLAPCAVGGAIDAEIAASIQAWAVVGAANNVLTGPEVAGLLRDRGISFVPDIIASAGAVADGIGRTVMDLPDRTALIDRLGDTAREVLTRAARTGVDTLTVAVALAAERGADPSGRDG